MKRLILLAGLAAVPVGVSAQLPSSDIVDRLVAVVGDSTVLYTQIEEELQRMQLGGAEVPPRTDPGFQEFFQSVLTQFVNRMLIIQAAAKDSLIDVDEAEIDSRVSDRIDQLAQQFGGQPALQQALAAEGLTLAEYREILKNEARSSQIQQLYMQLKLRDATPETVTEDEMLQRFQDVRGTLQQRPKLVTFRQVVIRPEASEAAMEAAKAEAEALLERARAGEDFAALATEYSDDPGSAALGGDLGWFRRGRMVREFEDAAFSILEGLTPVVETQFGFHIIKVERARAGERQARHILIRPERTEADLERARSVAGDVLERAQAGESMEALYSEFSDQEAPDSLTVPFDQISELPPAYAALRTASAGSFVGPLEYANAGDTRIAVVEVVQVREAGSYTFEDLRPQIASQLQQEKQQERLLDELRARTHIEIRM